MFVAVVAVALTFVTKVGIKVPAATLLKIVGLTPGTEASSLLEAISTHMLPAPPTYKVPAKVGALNITKLSAAFPATDGVRVSCVSLSTLTTV